MALANNPRVSVGHLLALAQHQVVREPGPRAAHAHRHAHGAGCQSGQPRRLRLALRLAPLHPRRRRRQILAAHHRLRPHHQLVASTKLQERAQQANELATREDVVLVTDEAFYNALQAQALLQVAKQTVNLRQTTQSQVNQLTQNKLRSTLDLTFANVNLSQAQLLQLDAQNNARRHHGRARRGARPRSPRPVLARRQPKEQPTPAPDEQALLDLAVKQRPDLQSIDLTRQSQEKFSRAQRDQMLPTLSALGTVGATPSPRPVLRLQLGWRDRRQSEYPDLQRLPLLRRRPRKHSCARKPPRNRRASSKT